MSPKKKKNKKSKLSRHHIIPSSRGGTSKLENIAGLTIKKHQDYHTLFQNKTPEEIIHYLVEDYWNGQWYHVERAYRKRYF